MKTKSDKLLRTTEFETNVFGFSVLKLNGCQISDIGIKVFCDKLLYLWSIEDWLDEKLSLHFNNNKIKKVQLLSDLCANLDIIDELSVANNYDISENDMFEFLKEL